MFKFETSEPTILKRAELEDLIKQAGGRKKPAEQKAGEKTGRLL